MAVLALDIVEKVLSIRWFERVFDESFPRRTVENYAYKLTISTALCARISHEPKREQHGQGKFFTGII